MITTKLTKIFRDAFGDVAIEHVIALGGGRSGARVLAVRIAGEHFVVRVPDRRRSGHDARAAREIGCMTLAAERGIGPALHYADRTTGITVSGRIENVIDGPARQTPGRVDRIAALLRRLHDGPALPADGNLLALLAGVEEAIRGKGATIPAQLRNVVDEASIACARFGLRTPCHNDLNPANFLETPARAYFIDWEVAGWGDPFIDIAQVGVFALLQPGAREKLLAAYLGRAPDHHERIHATLARVVALGIYAIGFAATAILAGESAPEGAARPLSDIIPELARGTATSYDVAATLAEMTLDEAKSIAYRNALAECA
jgi:hypothetical protein